RFSRDWSSDVCSSDLLATCRQTAQPLSQSSLGAVSGNLHGGTPNATRGKLGEDNRWPSCSRGHIAQKITRSLSNEISLVLIVLMLAIFHSLPVVRNVNKTSFTRCHRCSKYS